MPRTKSRRKSTRGRRDAGTPRGARVIEELRHQRYLAFVRAIIGAAGAKGPR